MSTILKSEVLRLDSENSVVEVRQKVRIWAVEHKFSLVDQTKLVTAASEIARNTTKYGGGGSAKLEALQDGLRIGLRLTFEDQGPGIPDIQLALRDGFTTGQGMGLGLGGAKRLVNEFDVQSTLGEGTKVVLIKWK